LASHTNAQNTRKALQGVVGPVRKCVGPVRKRPTKVAKLRPWAAIAMNKNNLKDILMKKTI
jgi:hypothetical protein